MSISFITGNTFSSPGLPKVMPPRGPANVTSAQIGGSWDFKDGVMLNGIVAPDQEAEPCIAPGGKTHMDCSRAANSALTGRIRQLKFPGCHDGQSD
jgi:hypothetical protein